MADETPGDTPQSPEPAPQADAPNPAEAAMSAVRSSLSGPETMIAGGALSIIVITYLLGDIIVGGWGVNWALLLLPVAAVGLIWSVKMRNTDVPIPYAFTLRVLSYGVTAWAIFEILWFIDGGDVDDFGIVAGLAFFAGAVAMLLGARQLTD